jgi:hypothetical protein
MNNNLRQPTNKSSILNVNQGPPSGFQNPTVFQYQGYEDDHKSQDFDFDQDLNKENRNNNSKAGYKNPFEIIEGKNSPAVKNYVLDSER